MSAINWEKATKHNPVPWISDLYADVEGVVINKDKEYFYEGENVKIKYSGDLIPECFIKRQSTHDGTLLFSHMTMKEIFTPLLQGEIFWYGNCPGDYTEFPAFYDVEYTIGNLLWLSEYLEHVNEEQGKMWAGCRDSFSLPMAIKYIDIVPKNFPPC